ncbi:MAG: PQQ-binding-like beta-propeller repeat protein [Bacteroidota bacterium]|nr:PQQ-binding-like beta-propeller repeat protein [Bacteroidota bacterium]
MSLKKYIQDNPTAKYTITLTVITAACVVSLFWWLLKDPTKSFASDVPGMDKRNAGGEVNAVVKIGEFFSAFTPVKSALTETWPRFRGENYDNISTSKVKLVDKFGDIKKRIRWTVELGEGHAGAAIYKGSVYVLDYDETKRADMLRCFSLTDGKESWRRWYKVAIKRNHGMSRTVPAISDKYIVSIGPVGQVMCVDRENGNYRWGIDIQKDYKTEVPLWYTGQCPLIDDNKAIIATGGKALMIAVDCQTGKKIWEAPNPGNYKMSHSSIMPYTFKGKKMYVYSAIGGVCGVAADGPDAGKILWESNAWNHNVIAPSPVCMPDGKIFLTAGYGGGSMLIQLKQDNNKFKAEVLQQYLPKDGLACEQQTPIYYQGHLFGILPKDGGTLRNQLVCVDPSSPQKIIWSSGKTTRFGLGPYLISDDKMFILSDEGTLTIVKPNISKYEMLDEAKVFDAQDAWAPMALADGYLVLRDAKKMVCVDIKK